jgi:hypothetical protein
LHSDRRRCFRFAFISGTASGGMGSVRFAGNTRRLFEISSISNKDSTMSQICCSLDFSAVILPLSYHFYHYPIVRRGESNFHYSTVLAIALLLRHSWNLVPLSSRSNCYYGPIAVTMKLLQNFYCSDPIFLMIPVPFFFADYVLVIGKLSGLDVGSQTFPSFRKHPGQVL